MEVDDFNGDNFIKKLKFFVKNNFDRQKDFARVIGVRETHASAYLAGTTYPRIETLYRIGRAGCDLNWLITGEAIKKDIPDTNVEIKGSSNVTIGNINDISAENKMLKELLKKYLD